jgi:hypothetical protein
MENQDRVSHPSLHPWESREPSEIPTFPQPRLRDPSSATRKQIKKGNRPLRGLFSFPVS